MPGQDKQRDKEIVEWIKQHPVRATRFVYQHFEESARNPDYEGTSLESHYRILAEQAQIVYLAAYAIEDGEPDGPVLSKVEP